MGRVRLALPHRMVDPHLEALVHRHQRHRPTPTPLRHLTVLPPPSMSPRHLPPLLLVQLYPHLLRESEREYTLRQRLSELLHHMVLRRHMVEQRMAQSHHQELKVSSSFSYWTYIDSLSYSLRLGSGLPKCHRCCRSIHSSCYTQTSSFPKRCPRWQVLRI